MHRSNFECYPNPDGTKGWVWNPITGSLDDCPNPNARRLAHGRLKERYLANKNWRYIDGGSGYYTNNHPSDDPFYPRFWPERLLELSGVPDFRGYSKEVRAALQYKKRRGIFVCDMADLFGIGVPEAWTKDVLDHIRLWPMHRFYLLTKQPQNLLQWSPFPPNCWVGVTVTNKDTMNPLWRLCDIKAGKRFVSFEPLLESVNLDMHTVNIPWAGGRDRGGRDYSPLINHLDWFIIGALTGTKWELLEVSQKWNIANINQGLKLMPYGNKWTLQPKIEWIQKSLEAADKAGVPVFLKDNLRPLFHSYGAPLDFYYKGHLRQEMPQ